MVYWSKFYTARDLIIKMKILENDVLFSSTWRLQYSTAEPTSSLPDITIADRITKVKNLTSE